MVSMVIDVKLPAQDSYRPSGVNMEVPPGLPDPWLWWETATWDRGRGTQLVATQPPLAHLHQLREAMY